MAGLFGAITHDLGQSLPNTFHRTAGNLYDGVAGQNGVLTGGGLKNTFKTATSIFGALNFIPTIAGLGVAGLANGIYNKASGKGGFFEGLAAPTKRAANWAKEGVTGTMGNTGKLVSGTGKAIAGTLTAPLDVAFGRTRTSTGLQPDYNKSTTYSDYITTQAPNSSTALSNPEQSKKSENPTPTSVPIPTEGGSPISSTDKPKTQKEIASEAKKEAEKKKKEEEKITKEEVTKTVDDLNKQQKAFVTKIDGAIKKVKELSDAEKVAEKQEKFDEQNKFLQEQILDKIPIKKTGTYSGKSFSDFTTALSPSSMPNEINNTSNPDEYNYLKDFIADIKSDITNKIDDNDDLPNLGDNTARKFETREGKKVSSSISDTVEIINDINRKLSVGQPLKKAHIENIFYILGHSATEDGALQGHIEGTIKDINKLKKERISVEPRHIEKQQDKLEEALNKMKTESGKAVSSIASSSRLSGKKLNKDNASDALEQLSDAMGSVTEQASAGEKRIDMTKPIAGISDAYQTLLSSIQSITA